MPTIGQEGLSPGDMCWARIGPQKIIALDLLSLLFQPSDSRCLIVMFADVMGFQLTASPLVRQTVTAGGGSPGSSYRAIGRSAMTIRSRSNR